MLKKKIGRPSKLDLLELQRLLNEGLSQSECARRMNVSRSCICEALKRLSMDNQTSEELVGESLIMIDIRKIVRELQQANDTVQSLLTHLRQIHKGKVESRLNERDLSALLIKASAESRHWAGSFSEILNRLSAYDRVQAFQKSVVQILIEEVSNEQKARILRKIRELSSK